MSDELPLLAGHGVSLRQLVERDVDALFAVFSDPQVMRYWSRPPMQDKAEARDMLRRIDAGRRDRALCQWGVVTGESDDVIGTATLFAIERTHRRAEVGFALGSHWWRRGFGTATAACLVRHAFADLGLSRLEADVDPRNAASLALLERLGFRREGLLRQRYRIGGEVQDSVYLGLLRDEWQA